MTEDDVKDKYCPMSFGHGADDVMTCCGSGCMWWEWAQESEYISEVQGFQVGQSTTEGYCGAKR